MGYNRRQNGFFSFIEKTKSFITLLILIKLENVFFKVCEYFNISGEQFLEIFLEIYFSNKNTTNCFEQLLLISAKFGEDFL
jgi:hypothetical protein